MKNNDILLDVIGDVDEKFIPELTQKKKNNSILKWTALGSICAAAIACAILLPKGNQKSPSVSPYETLLQTTHDHSVPGKKKFKSNIRFGDMGFEGIMAYDISELDNPNPWNSELNISSLPVYHNLAYTEQHISVLLSEQQMKEIAENTASSLDAEIKETKVTYLKDLLQGGFSDEIANGIYSFDVNCSNNIMITVYGNGQIKIDFDKNKLPSKYNFSYSNTSKDEAMRVLKYLSEEYNALLNYDNAVCFSVADRTFSGEESRSYYVYNRSDDIIQDILNYNLNYSIFAPDDSGNLMLIRLNNPLCASEYIGDYPIITENEATDLLLSGNYYSTVPEDYIRNGKITEDDIAKTELVYRNNGEEYYQPYYKYYIDLDTSALNMADNLKNYGIFYVPAINQEFIEDYNPDISFN